MKNTQTHIQLSALMPKTTTDFIPDLIFVLQLMEIHSPVPLSEVI